MGIERLNKNQKLYATNRMGYDQVWIDGLTVDQISVCESVLLESDYWSNCTDSGVFISYAGNCRLTISADMSIH